MTSVSRTPRLAPMHPSADLVFSGFRQIFQLELKDINKLGDETLIPDFTKETLDSLIEEAIQTLRENYRTALAEVDDNLIVVGDLHGNLTDLIRILLANGVPPQCKYLFLGDFVDRGSFSIEIISLILALLVLFPFHIFLIRGNHELREVNKTYGFYDEIEKHYGEASLWEHFNVCFEYLPVAFVVKQKYFCVHGGITKSLSLSALKSMELPLTNLPNLIQDLLWSDPNEMVEAYTMNHRGRGCEYGFMAALSFLKQNNLDYIVRGHQCVAEGVNIKTSMNVITVFSSSRYHKERKPNLCGFLIIRANNAFEKFCFPDVELIDRENANFFKVLPDSNLPLTEGQIQFPKFHTHSMVSLHQNSNHTTAFGNGNRKILQQPQFSPGALQAHRGSVIRRPSMPRLSIPNVQGGLQSIRAVSKINSAKMQAVQAAVKQTPEPSE